MPTTMSPMPRHRQLGRTPLHEGGRPRHREARADPSPSLERLIRPRLVDPDHLLALRALQPAADHPRHVDAIHDAARFELDLLDRVVGVTMAPPRKLVGVRHRRVTVGVPMYL